MKKFYAFALAMMLLLSSVAVYAESDNGNGVGGDLGVDQTTTTLEQTTTTTLEETTTTTLETLTTTTIEDAEGDETGTTLEKQPRGPKEPREGTKTECKQLYWMDKDNQDCGTKEFCGMYMYLGLRTFKTQEECLKARGNYKNMINVTHKFLEKREITKEMIKEARGKYAEAKQKYAEKKQEGIEARQKFMGKKEAVIQACKESESDDCKAKKEEIKTDAKEYVSDIADKIISHLEKLKASIQSNDKMSEEDAAAAIADIDAKIADVEAAKAKIESAATKEEVIAATKELKDQWNDIQKRVKLHAANTVNANLGNVAERLQQLGTKLNEKVSDMQSKGVDTSKIEPMVSEFNSLVAAADENYSQAQAKFNEAKTGETVDSSKVQEGIGLFQAANGQLKQAHAKLKDIVKELRAMNQPVADIETTTTIAA